MAIEKRVLGIFDSEDQAATAIEAVKQSAWSVVRVHSPIPSHKIADALQVKKSPAGWYTLVGGIIGFFFGFILAIYSAERWDLIVSGKPIRALVPFVIVGFEFTVLFAIFGNLLGFLHQARLPRIANLKQYDERCSGMHFGVLAACGADEQERLAALFREKGGDARVFA